MNDEEVYRRRMEVLDELSRIMSNCNYDPGPRIAAAEMILHNCHPSYQVYMDGSAVRNQQPEEGNK